MDDALQPVLVCFAVEEEAKPFRAWANKREGVTVLVTGMGARNAARAIGEALSTRPYGLVLTCGFAGGLDPGLRFGTVLFSSDPPGNLGQRLKSAGAQRARFHCIEKVVTTAAAKQHLRQQTDTHAVEMESGVICRICRERGIPSATVRVILDIAEEDLPLDFNLLLDDHQQMIYSRLAFTLAKSPAKIPALLRFRRRTEVAARQLASVLSTALQSLSSLHG